MTAPLVVKDLQSGFVGQTGTVWTIAPDCSFTVARQIGPNIADPHKKGRLTPEQQRRLRALLERTNLAGLPQHVGGPPQVNAHRIEVTYGAAVSALNLAPSSCDLKASRAAAADEPTARLLELADAMKDMTGD